VLSRRWFKGENFIPPASRIDDAEQIGRSHLLGGCFDTWVDGGGPILDKSWLRHCALAVAAAAFVAVDRMEAVLDEAVLDEALQDEAVQDEAVLDEALQDD
jgi:hypothetical protein